MRFRTTLQLHGKSATGIEVPAAIVAGLGSSRKPAVRVTINGHTYRSTIASFGGVSMLPVSAEQRAAAGVRAGDDVEVAVELDQEPREVAVPPDLMEALNRDVVAREHFEALSYSHKRQHVLAIDAAKTAETRQRRVAKTVSVLRDG